MIQPNKYFHPMEFDSPDRPGSGAQMMYDDFIGKLTYAREIAGIPFKITSGYRTPQHNKKVGGSPTSSHMKGLAVDIACSSSANRFKIVTSLLTAGFTRIGIDKVFIHVDDDPAKKQQIIWLSSMDRGRWRIL